jgi:hypothetical protein
MQNLLCEDIIGIEPTYIRFAGESLAIRVTCPLFYLVASLTLSRIRVRKADRVLWLSWILWASHPTNLSVNSRVHITPSPVVITCDSWCPRRDSNSQKPGV